MVLPSGRTAKPRAPFGLRLVVLIGVAVGAGCSEESRLAVDGPTPYARCLGRAVDAAGPQRVGGLTLSVEEGGLSITGLPAVPRLLAFAGPGPGPAEEWSRVGTAVRAALAAARPSLLLVLGDLGDDPVLARAVATALDQLGVPVLLVGGGRDTLATLTAADALPNVVDLSPLRQVRLIPGSNGSKAAYTLVPIAGALDGRYARTRDSCGYASDDLDGRDLPEPLPGERRLLVAWQAPIGLDPAGAAADGGSAPLAAFASASSAGAGLFAWPHAQAGRPRSTRDGSVRSLGAPADDLGLVVPRLAGPALERADGSRLPPGFALIELGAQGPIVRDLPRLGSP